MTMKKTQAFRKLLSLAKRCSKRGRSHLIHHAPDWFIRNLCHTCKAYKMNKLPKGKSRLTATIKRRLCRYPKDVSYMSKCKSMKKARQRLVQRGGFLPALLPLLAIIGKGLLGGAAAAGAGALVKKITRS